MEDFDAFTLIKGRKQSCFDNHRKFLLPGITFRRNKISFIKYKIILKVAQPIKSGAKILKKIEQLRLKKSQKKVLMK